MLTPNAPMYLLGGIRTARINGPRRLLCAIWEDGPGSSCTFIGYVAAPLTATQDEIRALAQTYYAPTNPEPAQ